METTYRELQRDPAEAARAFTLDYAPLVPRLNLLSGRILDVGGGLGITREWLNAGVRDVVADPSADWLSPDWAFLESSFPSRRRPGPRAQALGEALPFADASFDSVLALWMLNHALDPAAVVREIGRVLRPGGRLLEPSFAVMERSWMGVYLGYEARRR